MVRNIIALYPCYPPHFNATREGGGRGITPSANAYELDLSTKFAQGRHFSTPE